MQAMGQADVATAISITVPMPNCPCSACAAISDRDHSATRYRVVSAEGCRSEMSATNDTVVSALTSGCRWGFRRRFEVRSFDARRGASVMTVDA